MATSDSSGETTGSVCMRPDVSTVRDAPSADSRITCDSPFTRLATMNDPSRSWVAPRNPSNRCDRIRRGADPSSGTAYNSPWNSVPTAVSRLPSAVMPACR